MQIDREATPFVAAAAVPAVVAAATGRSRLAVTLGALSLGLGAFFRDPQRSPDRDPVTDAGVVLSPADGKIVHAGPAQPDVAPPGEWLQVSIFLSLLDVHINRAPWGGRVTAVSHVPGRYLAAYRAESGMRNERSEITVERVVDGTTRRIVFRQIVGQLARRVVTRVRPGDDIATGQRIGLMKFGSRMDVFLPTDVTLEVSAGTRAVAGETVLGRWLDTDGR
ncbi:MULTISPECIES: phosphatidylserine decarboxylase [unclassified Janibacter]|uniref:phosphatidylserine decarboxylase n=1 Tax=unclassified Janibacter TaxID=2649294 RepID=UPI003CFD043D